MNNGKRRKAILDHNRAIREGTAEQPRRLDEGYAALRIPVEDWPVLRRMYPELEAKDHDIRLAAWHKFRASPIGEKYLVTRTPRQVQNSQKGIIVK